MGITFLISQASPVELEHYDVWVLGIAELRIRGITSSDVLSLRSCRYRKADDATTSVQNPDGPSMTDIGVNYFNFFFISFVLKLRDICKHPMCFQHLKLILLNN